MAKMKVKIPEIPWYNMEERIQLRKKRLLLIYHLHPVHFNYVPHENPGNAPFTLALRNILYV